MALEKKLAVVTGGARGIGEAITRKLHHEGFSVVVLDREEPKGVSDLVPTPGYVDIDVRSAESVSRAVHLVEADYGPVSVVCNNAGVSSMHSVVDLTEEEWDLNFDVNTKGTFLITRAFLPAMIERKQGCIVNMASMAGVKGVPLLAHYAASKWAVIGFTKSVALEVAPYGIRVNAVCPGYVQTSMQARELVWEANLRHMTPDQVFDEYIRLTPMGRIELPEDVAKAVYMLVSENASFITGEAINVTGGADL